MVLTNLDKLYWPREGIAKGHLLDHYLRMAPVLVPHLADRPMILKRYPNGIEEAFFFQHNVVDAPAWLRRAPLSRSGRSDEKTSHYAVIDDPMALLWLVNLGCIDLNPWQSRADSPDSPTQVLFDLDPADGLPFDRVVEAALLVRDALEAAGLRGYPRTSGASGMHILVPVAPGPTFEEVRMFARIVSEALVRARPDLVTTLHVGQRSRTARLPRPQPERARAQHRQRLLGAAAPRRAGRHPAALGRGAAGARPPRLHDGRRGEPGGARGRPGRGAPHRPAGPGGGRGPARAPGRVRAARRALAAALAALALAGCSRGDPAPPREPPTEVGTGYFVGRGAAGLGASVDLFGSDAASRAVRQALAPDPRGGRGAPVVAIASVVNDGSAPVRTPRFVALLMSGRAVPMPDVRASLSPSVPAQDRALRLLGSARARVGPGGSASLHLLLGDVNPLQVESVRMVSTVGEPISLSARRR